MHRGSKSHLENKEKEKSTQTERGAGKILETKLKEKIKVCISAIGLPLPPSLYLQYLKQCSGLHGPG